jgi:hypothetical protein
MPSAGPGTGHYFKGGAWDQGVEPSVSQAPTPKTRPPQAVSQPGRADRRQGGERAGTMSFWDEHAKAETIRKLEPDGACNAPAECLKCGHVGQDVFFGSCLRCFQAWEDNH